MVGLFPPALMYQLTGEVKSGKSLVVGQSGVSKIC